MEKPLWLGKPSLALPIRTCSTCRISDWPVGWLDPIRLMAERRL
jgi:hypothetical protein